MFDYKQKDFADVLRDDDVVLNSLDKVTLEIPSTAIRCHQPSTNDPSGGPTAIGSSCSRRCQRRLPRWLVLAWSSSQIGSMRCSDACPRGDVDSRPRRQTASPCRTPPNSSLRGGALSRLRHAAPAPATACGRPPGHGTIAWARIPLLRPSGLRLRRMFRLARAVDRADDLVHVVILELRHLVVYGSANKYSPVSTSTASGSSGE